MATFGQRLAEERKKRKLSQVHVAKAIGVSQAQVSQYEGDKDYPKPEVLERLANLFGVSLDFLAGRDTQRQNPPGLLAVGPMVSLPIYGSVKAGSPCIAEQIPEDYAYVDRQLIRGNIDDFFWLRVEGDSMRDAGIVNGSLALVECECAVEDGQIAVVALDGEDGTVKRVRFIGDDTIALIPANTDLKEEFYPRDRVRIIGRVRAYFKEL